MIADTLSRAYLPEEADEPLTEEFEVNVIQTLPIFEQKLKKLQRETSQDSTLQESKSTVERGWPVTKS